ncbi:hypothetical protein HPG69_016666 [Diceros bicornis minor]|uniref:Uncharacterized protein n=1 Tax=Diceros bicornis minor TaxID=77932 RepID=A0A7J7FNJ2_DICBM|nr:hypothetical protein HPG69_016666 [Diceros bicornis minor]
MADKRQHSSGNQIAAEADGEEVERDRAKCYGEMLNQVTKITEKKKDSIYIEQRKELCKPVEEVSYCLSPKLDYILIGKSCGTEINLDSQLNASCCCNDREEAIWHEKGFLNDEFMKRRVTTFQIHMAKGFTKREANTDLEIACFINTCVNLLGNDDKDEMQEKKKAGKKKEREEDEEEEKYVNIQFHSRKRFQLIFANFWHLIAARGHPGALPPVLDVRFVVHHIEQETHTEMFPYVVPTPKYLSVVGNLLRERQWKQKKGILEIKLAILDNMLLSLTIVILIYFAFLVKLIYEKISTKNSLQKIHSKIERHQFSLIEIRVDVSERNYSGERTVVQLNCIDFILKGFHASSQGPFSFSQDIKLGYQACPSIILLINESHIENNIPPDSATITDESKFSKKIKRGKRNDLDVPAHGPIFHSPSMEETYVRMIKGLNQNIVDNDKAGLDTNINSMSFRINCVTIGEMKRECEGVIMELPGHARCVIQVESDRYGVLRGLISSAQLAAGWDLKVKPRRCKEVNWSLTLTGLPGIALNAGEAWSTKRMEYYFFPKEAAISIEEDIVSSATNYGATVDRVKPIRGLVPRKFAETPTRFCIHNLKCDWRINFTKVQCSKYIKDFNPFGIDLGIFTYFAVFSNFLNWFFVLSPNFIQNFDCLRTWNKLKLKFIIMHYDQSTLLKVEGPGGEALKTTATLIERSEAYKMISKKAPLLLFIRVLYQDTILEQVKLKEASAKYITEDSVTGAGLDTFLESLGKTPMRRNALKDKPCPQSTEVAADILSERGSAGLWQVWTEIEVECVKEQVTWIWNSVQSIRFQSNIHLFNNLLTLFARDTVLISKVNAIHNFELTRNQHEQSRTAITGGHEIKRKEEEGRQTAREMLTALAQGELQITSKNLIPGNLIEMLSHVANYLANAVLLEMMLKDKNRDAFSLDSAYRLPSLQSANRYSQHGSINLPIAVLKPSLFILHIFIQPMGFCKVTAKLLCSQSLLTTLPSPTSAGDIFENLLSEFFLFSQALLSPLFIGGKGASEHRMTDVGTWTPVPVEAIALDDLECSVCCRNQTQVPSKCRGEREDERRECSMLAALKNVKTFHMIEYMAPYDDIRGVKAHVVKSEKDDFRDTSTAEPDIAENREKRASEFALGHNGLSFSKKQISSDENLESGKLAVNLWYLFMLKKIQAFISPSFQVDHLKAIMVHRNNPKSSEKQQEHLMGKESTKTSWFNFEELLTTRKVKVLRKQGDVMLLWHLLVEKRILNMSEKTCAKVVDVGNSLELGNSMRKLKCLKDGLYGMKREKGYSPLILGKSRFWVMAENGEMAAKMVKKGDGIKRLAKFFVVRQGLEVIEAVAIQMKYNCHHFSNFPNMGLGYETFHIGLGEMHMSLHVYGEEGDNCFDKLVDVVVSYKSSCYLLATEKFCWNMKKFLIYSFEKSKLPIVTKEFILTLTQMCQKYKIKEKKDMGYCSRINPLKSNKKALNPAVNIICMLLIMSRGIVAINVTLFMMIQTLNGYTVKRIDGRMDERTEVIGNRGYLSSRFTLSISAFEFRAYWLFVVIVAVICSYAHGYDRVYDLASIQADSVHGSHYHSCIPWFVKTKVMLHFSFTNAPFQKKYLDLKITGKEVDVFILRQDEKRGRSNLKVKGTGVLGTLNEQHELGHPVLLQLSSLLGIVIFYKAGLSMATGNLAALPLKYPSAMSILLLLGHTNVGNSGANTCETPDGKFITERGRQKILFDFQRSETGKMMALKKPCCMMHALENVTQLINFRNDLNGFTFPQFVTSIYKSRNQSINDTKLMAATRDTHVVKSILLPRCQRRALTCQFFTCRALICIKFSGPGADYEIVPTLKITILEKSLPNFLEAGLDADDFSPMSQHISVEDASLGAVQWNSYDFIRRSYLIFDKLMEKFFLVTPVKNSHQMPVSLVTERRESKMRHPTIDRLFFLKALSGPLYKEGDHKQNKPKQKIFICYLRSENTIIFIIEGSSTSIKEEDVQSENGQKRLSNEFRLQYISAMSITNTHSDLQRPVNKEEKYYIVTGKSSIQKCYITQHARKYIHEEYVEKMEVIIQHISFSFQHTIFRVTKAMLSADHMTHFSQRIESRYNGHIWTNGLRTIHRVFSFIAFISSIVEFLVIIEDSFDLVQALLEGIKKKQVSMMTIFILGNHIVNFVEEGWWRMPKLPNKLRKIHYKVRYPLPSFQRKRKTRHKSFIGLMLLTFFVRLSKPQRVTDWLHKRSSCLATSLHYHENERPMENRTVMRYYQINLEIRIGKERHIERQHERCYAEILFCMRTFFSLETKEHITFGWLISTERSIPSSFFKSPFCEVKFSIFWLKNEKQLRQANNLNLMITEEVIKTLMQICLDARRRRKKIDDASHNKRFSQTSSDFVALTQLELFIYLNKHVPYSGGCIQLHIQKFEIFNNRTTLLYYHLIYVFKIQCQTKRYNRLLKINTRNESGCKGFIYYKLHSESRQNKKSYGKIFCLSSMVLPKKAYSPIPELLKKENTEGNQNPPVNKQDYRMRGIKHLDPSLFPNEGHDHFFFPKATLKQIQEILAMEICLFSELMVKFSFMMSTQEEAFPSFCNDFQMSSTNINVLLTYTCDIETLLDQLYHIDETSVTIFIAICHFSTEFYDLFSASVSLILPLLDALNLSMSTLSLHSIESIIVKTLYACFHKLVIVSKNLKETQNEYIFLCTHTNTVMLHIHRDVPTNLTIPHAKNKYETNNTYTLLKERRFKRTHCSPTSPKSTTIMNQSLSLLAFNSLALYIIMSRGPKKRHLKFGGWLEQPAEASPDMQAVAVKLHVQHWVWQCQAMANQNATVVPIFSRIEVIKVVTIFKEDCKWRRYDAILPQLYEAMTGTAFRRHLHFLSGNTNKRLEHDENFPTMSLKANLESIMHMLPLLLAKCQRSCAPVSLSIPDNGQLLLWLQGTVMQWLQPLPSLLVIYAFMPKRRIKDYCMVMLGPADTYHQVLGCNHSVGALPITNTTAGHRYPGLQHLTIARSHTFILVYSVTKKQTLEEPKPFCELILGIKGNVHKYPIVLVGNKYDKSH